MRRDELEQLLVHGENSGVEFKRDDCRPEQLAKEIVAMSNLQGGTVLLGVEDDGTVSGIARPNLEEWVMDVIASKVHPSILPFYEEVQLPDSRRVAVISFPTGSSKPYVVRHSGREEIYVRVGSTSRLATREQQASLFASGGLLHPEVLPVSGSSIASLDLNRVEDYLRRVLRDPSVPGSEEEWSRRLEGMGFLVESAGRMLATIAGIVLFGFAPRRFLRQSGVRVQVFAGTDVDTRVLLDHTLDGSLLGLWRADPAGSVSLAQQDEGLIERLADQLRPYLQEPGEVNAQFRRDQQVRFPLEVVRELAINALVHRDWTRPIQSEIQIFSDRLEVLSPGGLHNSMTVEKMLAGQRLPRNPLMVETMRDYGYVEARGMGIRTKVVPLTRRHLGSDPIFEANSDYLRTTLQLSEPH